MSNISKYKNGWFLLLFIMIGIVLGGLIAESTAGIESLSWLSYGNTFGLDSPLVIWECLSLHLHCRLRLPLQVLLA